MWDTLEAARDSLVHAVLAHDAAAVNAQFRTLFAGTHLDGMSHGNALFADPARNPYERDFVARRTMDALLSLAEATGAARLPCFGQRRLELYIDDLQRDLGAPMAIWSKSAAVS